MDSSPQHAPVTAQAPSEREALELAAILDSMADGLFVVDTAHTIRRWNSAMARLTQYTAEEALGRKCHELLRPDCGEGAAALMPCLPGATEASEQRETYVRRKDGEEVPVLAGARVLRDAAGETLGAVVTLSDLSSLKSLESEVDRLRREMAGRHEFHSLVGKSHLMREVFGLIEMAAASPVTVLVQGETGTGKELVAKAIHYQSARRDGPLVSVNCSALTESLLESELFGHVRGAFTGAVGDRPGRFELASGGSLFLDEVGEIPPLVQVKLLRVLQERTIERVGESRPRNVDVRLIAATHRDLRTLVREGVFREDLFYRLKVFPIQLPPLRERKEDIPLLVARFIERFRETTGKRVSGLSPDATRIVMDYCWPGNVRELENAIEHAFVTCPGGAIGPFDLPIEIRRVELKRQLCGDAAGAPTPGPFAEDNAPAREPAPVVRRKRPVTRQELLEALEASGWNKAEAGRRLGITRTSVWRRMKALDIPLEP